MGPTTEFREPARALPIASTSLSVKSVIPKYFASGFSRAHARSQYGLESFAGEARPLERIDEGGPGSLVVAGADRAIPYRDAGIAVVGDRDDNSVSVFLREIEGDFHRFVESYDIRDKGYRIVRVRRPVDLGAFDHEEKSIFVG